MNKRRYTDDEITEMKTQIFEDDWAEREKFKKIAKWVSEKTGKTCGVEFTNTMRREGVSIHVPYYYISVPQTQYDRPNPWLLDRLTGPTKCETPFPGIGNREGWMLQEDIPDVGKVEVYVHTYHCETHW